MKNTEETLSMDRKGMMVEHDHWKKECINQNGDKEKKPEKKNAREYLNNKQTKGVEFIKTNGIKIHNRKTTYFRKNWEPTETIEDEWVQRTYPDDKDGNTATAMGLMSKRGRFQYDYVPPPEPVKKKIRIEKP